MEPKPTCIRTSSATEHHITPQSPLHILSAQLDPAVSKKTDPRVNEPGRGQPPRLFSFDPMDSQRLGNTRLEWLSRHRGAERHGRDTIPTNLGRSFVQTLGCLSLGRCSGYQDGSARYSGPKCDGSSGERSE